MFNFSKRNYANLSFYNDIDFAYWNMRMEKCPIFVNDFDMFVALEEVFESPSDVNRKLLKKKQMNRWIGKNYC